MAGRRREGQQPLGASHCHHSHRQKLSSCSHHCSNHNYLTPSGCSCRLKLEQSMCGTERRLIWLGRAQAGSAEGGGQLRAERARLPRPRGFARSLHCSDQGRGSCHSQAVLVLLPGRKGQDGDLGAAPVLSTLWQRRGTAGRPQAPAFRLLPVPRAPWFPSIRERSCLVWKPAPNDLPAPLGKSAPHTC